MRLLLALLLTGYALDALAAKPDLQLIDEVRKDRTTIYIGESRYYLDRSSIVKGHVNSIPYYSARTFEILPSHPTFVDEIAIVCNHPVLGLAASVRKMGVVKANAVKFNFDQGPVRSLADFDLKRLENNPTNGLSKVARAVCSLAHPKAAVAPSN